MNLHLLHPTRIRNNTAPSFNATVPRLTLDETLYRKEFGRIKLRPISFDDEPRMVAFHEQLSEEDVYLRYFEHISLDTRTLHERLAKVCSNTADSFAIVAEHPANTRQPAEILAVGRLTTTETPGVAAFATVMADKYQNTALPRDLIKHLIELARGFDFSILTGDLLVADHDTLNLCRGLGFSLHTIPEDGIVRVTYAL